MTIDVLPDDVLLNIFDSDRISNPERYPPWAWAKEWDRLAHVCRKWRHLILASPLRLKLQLLCTDGTPVRNDLDIWPAIPIIMNFGDDQNGIKPDDEDDAIATLEHPDRLCQVHLDIKGSSQFGRITSMMQEPCPMMTRLSLSSIDRNEPVLPEGFLGGSAPRLREISLYGVSFPALPTLLFSARNLVELTLRDIPPRDYISPAAMVAHLAALSRLEAFRIGLSQRPTSHSDHLPPPRTRTVLPALLELSFSGVSKYLENFVARIDTPQLDFIEINYWDQETNFEVPQLSEFFNRSENFKKTLSNNCEVLVCDDQIAFTIIGGATATDKAGCWHLDAGISLHVLCRGMDRNISHLTHVLSWISPILSDMVHLHFQSPEQAIGDDIECLQLLRRFPSVKTLHVPAIIAPLVSRALEGITGEMVTEVLPALELLYLEDQPVSSVDRFSAVRRDSGYPVTIVNTS